MALAAGIDTWNLFYLGVSRLESPLYARLALEGIHDPDRLGTRVVMQVLGALAGVLLKLLPAWALLGLLTLPVAVFTSMTALRHGREMPKLAPAMGMNVLINILTPILVGVGLLIAA